jgi:hypothetical protein
LEAHLALQNDEVLLLKLFVIRTCKIFLANELNNSGEGLLAPKVLGLFFFMHTNEVVHAHSIVFHTPKEMWKK